MLHPELVDLVSNSKHLVILTGAGISTESGLADYRGPNGVWTRRDKGLKPLPTPAIETVQPNQSHQAIAKLFDLGILKFLISQNVDNLHIKSGVQPDKLAELHGNFNRFKCLECDSRFTMEEIGWNKTVLGKGYRKDKPHPDQPSCPYCNGRIISSVVNFGDPMPKRELEQAFYHANKADVFMVLGSSLVVQPASSLPVNCYNNGGSVIIVNKGETPLDNLALKIEDNVGNVLKELVDELVTKYQEI